MNFNYIIVLQVIHRGGLIMTTISLRVNDDAKQEKTYDHTEVWKMLGV